MNMVRPTLSFQVHKWKKNYIMQPVKKKSYIMQPNDKS